MHQIFVLISTASRLTACGEVSSSTPLTFKAKLKITKVI